MALTRVSHTLLPIGAQCYVDFVKRAVTKTNAGRKPVLIGNPAKPQVSPAVMAYVPHILGRCTVAMRVPAIASDKSPDFSPVFSNMTETSRLPVANGARSR